MQDRISMSGAVGGIDIPGGSLTQTPSAQIPYSQSVGPAFAGTLTTRGGNNAGTLTLVGTHGLAQNDIIDVYFAAGVQYRCTVGVVAGQAIPITGGLGVNLPIQDAAVIACERVRVDLGTIATGFIGLAAYCPKRAHVLIDDGDDTVTPLELAAGIPRVWMAGMFGTAPHADAIEYVDFSTADTAAAAVVNLGLSKA